MKWGKGLAVRKYLYDADIRDYPPVLDCISLSHLHTRHRSLQTSIDYQHRLRDSLFEFIFHEQRMAI